MNVMGAHNASNAAAACTLALISGADEAKLKEGLLSSGAIKGRLFANTFSNMSVIDDAYNASYNAVIAALDTLNLQTGHKVMIFGDMGELGDAAIELHESVGEHAASKVDELLCVGPLTEHTCKKAGNKAKHFNCHADLVKYARTVINNHPYTSFLVKGSHSMHMEEITKELIALGAK